MPDQIYVVIDQGRLVKASRRFQGAENIRIDEARRLGNLAVFTEADPDEVERAAYQRMTIQNVELEEE